MNTKSILKIKKIGLNGTEPDRWFRTGTITVGCAGLVPVPIQTWTETVAGSTLITCRCGHRQRKSRKWPTLTDNASLNQQIYAGIGISDFHNGRGWGRRVGDSKEVESRDGHRRTTIRYLWARRSAPTSRWEEQTWAIERGSCPTKGSCPLDLERGSDWGR